MRCHRAEVRRNPDVGQMPQRCWHRRWARGGWLAVAWPTTGRRRADCFSARHSDLQMHDDLWEGLRQEFEGGDGVLGALRPGFRSVAVEVGPSVLRLTVLRDHLCTDSERCYQTTESTL